MIWGPCVIYNINQIRRRRCTVGIEMNKTSHHHKKHKKNLGGISKNGALTPQRNHFCLQYIWHFRSLWIGRGIISQFFQEFTLYRTARSGCYMFTPPNSGDHFASFFYKRSDTWIYEPYQMKVYLVFIWNPLYQLSVCSVFEY